MADGSDMGTSVDAPQKKGKRRAQRPAAGGQGMSQMEEKLLEDPAFMEALKAQLGGQLAGAMAVDKSVFYKSLPQQCKARVRALKNLQVENQHLECRFHKELHELECRFEAEFQTLCDKRRDIVTGTYEPTEKECEFALDDEDEEDENEDEEDAEEKKTNGDDAEKKTNGDDAEKKTNGEADGDALAADVEKKVQLGESQYDENTKGLPQFWLTALQNVSLVQEIIQEHDLDILKHLEDVKCQLNSDPVGFKLSFFFSENEFFTNKVLTKEYRMKIEVDAADPFSFDGGEIVSGSGCEIDWNKGKNVTVKTIKKKQKNKKQGQTRTITKQVKADSFFNFFNPPTLPENEDEEVEEEVAAAVAQDYELGLFMKENFVPKAVLYFTGEENDEEDEEDDEYDDMDEEYDEDQDPDYQPPAGGEQPQECKQQ